jgi:hypothetical protein
MAPSAIDFYKNGPSFLQRHLPLWLTIHVQRAIAVLVTVMAIGFPLFGFAPKLYGWFVRSYMAKLHHRIRLIDKELKTRLTVPQVTALRTELESIDQAAHILPMRHSDLFLSIMRQIDRERTRLASRLAEARGE